MKLLIETIDLGKEWKSAFKSNLNDIPILFKYLGENKAIEPLTGEIFIMNVPDFCEFHPEYNAT